MELKGSKTEENLIKAFAGKVVQEINIHILQVRQKKKAMNK